MQQYRIVAISEAVAESVRSTRRSPRYGHPVHEELATGYGPCRQCLRFFEVGRESRLLFTFDPFAGVEPYPLPGPVFIHAAPCSTYPEDGGFPETLAAHALTLHAYGRGRLPRAIEHLSAGPVGPVVQRLLSRDDVDYIHVRDSEAGCFDLAVHPAHVCS